LYGERQIVSDARVLLVVCALGMNCIRVQVSAFRTGTLQLHANLVVCTRNIKVDMQLLDN
jgi:hypothetical protein